MHIKDYCVCTICHENFRTEYSLKIHRNDVHTISVFKCFTCGWKDFNYFNYEEHTEKHYHESNYKCFDCDTFSNKHSKFDITKHVQSHLTKLSRNSVQCEICEKYFTRLQMTPHMKRHSHVADSIKCNKCNYFCKTANALLVHLQLVHRNFQCDLCEYAAQTRRKLTLHKSEKHERRNDYVECRECRYFFLSTKMFEKHAIEVHPTLSWKDLAEYKHTLECSICGKVKQNARALIDHMSVHSEYRSKLYNNSQFFECKSCLSFYLSRKSFETHVTKMHSESCSNDSYNIRNELKCSICEKTAKDLRPLNQHIRKHQLHQEKQKKSDFIECKTCHLFYKTRRAFNVHSSQVHNSGVVQDQYQLRTELKCWFCGDVHKNITRLNIHVSRHKVPDKVKSKNNIRCKCCKFFYASKVTFETHVIKKHSGSSPEELIEYVDELKCWICSKVRINVREINSHINSHPYIKKQRDSNKKRMALNLV